MFFVRNVKNSRGNLMDSSVVCSFLVVFVLLISANFFHKLKRMKYSKRQELLNICVYTIMYVRIGNRR